MFLRNPLLALALGGSMTTSASPTDRCCAVIELRQYTVKPGQRETLIELFERELLDPQEAVGMTVVGQFRDRQRDDRFVWIRGFPDMTRRHAALDRFYGGPVWAAQRDAANATMIDSDDVLLLKPARPDVAFRLEPRDEAAGEGKERLVVAGLYTLTESSGPALVSRLEERVLPALAASGVHVRGVFVTETAPNTFRRLPVREGENVLIWFGEVEPARAAADGSISHLADAGVLDGLRPAMLVLSPTRRSRLGRGH